MHGLRQFWSGGNLQPNIPLDTLEAPEYNFIINPLAYISHQDQLPEAKEAAVEAYALRVTWETYLTV